MQQTSVASIFLELPVAQCLSGLSQGKKTIWCAGCTFLPLKQYQLTNWKGESITPLAKVYVVHIQSNF